MGSQFTVFVNPYGHTTLRDANIITFGLLAMWCVYFVLQEVIWPFSSD